VYVNTAMKYPDNTQLNFTTTSLFAFDEQRLIADATSNQWLLSAHEILKSFRGDLPYSTFSATC
jgi:hypothetical protein